MQEKVARRQFLKTVGAGALASAGVGLPAIELLGSPMAEAAPADRASQGSKMPRLFPGCCAYSYRSELTQGRMTLEDFIRKAVELRIDAVDMTVYYYKSTDPAYLASLRHIACRHAVSFSGVACGSSMVQADASKRAEVLSDIKKWVDVTDRLGAPHLRIFAGKLPPGATLQQAIGWVAETMKAACDYSGSKGISLGMEDHVGVSQSADVCLEVMHRVDSPYAGINLDIAHFVPTPAQDAYAQIAACIPYATNTHIKNTFDDRKTIDLDRVWRLFAQAGFKGYMSVEYEGDVKGGEPAVTGVPKLIERVRALCKKYSSV